MQRSRVDNSRNETVHSRQHDLHYMRSQIQSVCLYCRRIDACSPAPWREVLDPARRMVAIEKMKEVEEEDAMAAATAEEACLQTHAIGERCMKCHIDVTP